MSPEAQRRGIVCTPVPAGARGSVLSRSTDAAADYAPAPSLGEHTREIAAALLGLDDAAIDQLTTDRVIESPTN